MQIWTERYFQVKISHANNAIEENLFNQILIDTNQVENLINQYADKIGDIEHNLAGEESNLDQYLCQRF